MYNTLWLTQHMYAHVCTHELSSLRRISCITHMHWWRKRKKKRDISENSAYRLVDKEGVEDSYQKQFVMLLPSSSSFIFLLMFLSLLFFLPSLSPPPMSLSVQSLPQHSAFVCATSYLYICLCVRVSLCVGVGDKAVLQHHCVYKAPVCCLLLLITAQHNVSAQLAMHKSVCACMCVCARERETEEAVGAEW